MQKNIKKIHANDSGRRILLLPQKDIFLQCNLVVETVNEAITITTR